MDEDEPPLSLRMDASFEASNFSQGDNFRRESSASDTLTSQLQAANAGGGQAGENVDFAGVRWEGKYQCTVGGLCLAEPCALSVAGG